MKKRLLFAAIYAGLAGLLGLAGFWLLFTAFKPYDDEGYVLFSLATFSRVGSLYDTVYSQYGPFFYLIQDVLHRLVDPDFTHTEARFITLFYWLCTSACCGHLVWHRAKSAGWALLAFSATFAHLWQMTAEPGHPGGMITLLVALTAWAGGEAIMRDKLHYLAAVIALGGTMTFFTKINVGVFIFAGAGAWLLLQSTDRRLGLAGPWLAGGFIAIAPWLLMHSLLDQPWVWTFAVVASCSGLGIALSANVSRRGFFPLSAWAVLITVTAVSSLVIVGLTMLRGTSLPALIDGVLLGPLRHPTVYSAAVHWRPGALTFALISLVGAIVTQRTRAWEYAWFRNAVFVVRFGLVALTIYALTGWTRLNSLALVMSYGLSLSWLLVIPLDHSAEGLAAARLRSWLALLASLQVLHAYPVGGSQIGWGTFLWIPLLIMAAAQSSAVLRPVLRAARYFSAIATAAALFLAGVFLQFGWKFWQTSEPLKLPGAESLRLPEPLRSQIRAVTLNAAIHADTLFSLPGMFSFNLWTGRPAPTASNVTHWFNLLSPERQQEIIRQLESDPRAIIIVQTSLLEYLKNVGIPVTGPLYSYLRSQFAPAMGIGNYEIWAKRGRHLAPFSTAQLYRHTEGAGYRLELDLLIDHPATLGRLEWLDCSGEVPRVVQVLDTSNTRVSFRGLRSDGEPIGSPQSTTWPAPLPHLGRLTFDTPVDLGTLPQHDAILRAYDPQGHLVNESVFLRSAPTGDQ